MKEITTLLSTVAVYMRVHLIIYQTPGKKVFLSAALLQK